MWIRGQGFDEEGFKVPNAGQPQLQITKWAIPVLTGVIMILGPQQGEQQRPPGSARGGRPGQLKAAA